MIKYICAAAVLAAAYGINGAVEVTTISLAMLATIFYMMTFRLFVGLSRAELVKPENLDVLNMAVVYMIYFTSTVVVFNSPYAYVAFLAMPWVAIQGLINLLSVLIKLDIIGINHQ